MSPIIVFRILAAIAFPFFGYLSLKVMAHAFTLPDAWSVGVFLFGFLVMLLALACLLIATHRFKSAAPSDSVEEGKL